MSDHVSRQVIGQPWALEPDKLDSVARIVLAHEAGERLSAEQIAERLGSMTPSKPAYELRSRVAVIPVFGIIAKRMDLFSRISGGTSTDRLRADLAAAIEDPEVSAILLDIDSPGGSVAGPAELAATIAAARGTKPIIASANELAASGAYWIAAAADLVVANETANVGSIGVYAVYRDTSEREKRDGVKTTIIRAGRYKVTGNPYEPMTDEDRATLQARVDYYYSLFVEAVASYRGASVDQVVRDMADGRVFIGRQAVTAGLVDRIATFDEILSELAAGQFPQSRVTVKGASIMAEKNQAGADQTKPTHPTNSDTKPTNGGGGEAKPSPAPAPAPAPAPEAAAGSAPAASPPLTAADVDKAAAAAVAAEKSRVKQIRELCATAHLPRLAAGLVDSDATVEQARAAIFDELVKTRVPLGDDAGADSNAKPDPDAEFKAEYARDRKIHERCEVSEEAYIRSRRISAGLEKLRPAPAGK